MVRPQVHGWAKQIPDKLSRVRLPEKLKCKVCMRKKQVHEYSNRQLDDARAKIFKTGDSDAPTEIGWITCITCNSAQLNELQCYLCNKYKDIDSFAKAQRKTPDAAKCIDCMFEQNPVHSSDNDDDDGCKSQAEETRATSNKVKEDDVEEDDEDEKATNSVDDENSRSGGISLRKSDSSASAWITQPRRGVYAAHPRSMASVHSNMTASTEFAMMARSTAFAHYENGGLSASALPSVVEGPSPATPTKTGAPPSMTSIEAMNGPGTTTFDRRKYGSPSASAAASVVESPSPVASKKTGASTPVTDTYFAMAPATTTFDRRRYGAPTASVVEEPRATPPMRAGVFPLRSSKRHTPGKASAPVEKRDKWGKPENPNAGPGMEHFDVQNNWGKKLEHVPTLTFDDELP